jgi:hypothetical protein
MQRGVSSLGRGITNGGPVGAGIVSRGIGRRLSGCTILTTTCLQKDFFLTGEEDGTICGIIGIEVLSQLWWGRLRVMLGVHHTLVWNGILQHSWGVVARIIVGPVEG